MEGLTCTFPQKSSIYMTKIFKTHAPENGMAILQAKYLEEVKGQGSGQKCLDLAGFSKRYNST